jgi:hypothetical protein
VCTIRQLVVRMSIECRAAPASLVRMPYMPHKAQYEAQYDDEIGSEGDGYYSSEEIDERYLQTALNRCTDYMKSKPIIRMFDGSTLRKALSRATAQDEEDTA